MRAEKGRDDIDAAHRSEPPRRPQHARLGLAVEAVARFDFNRCRAFGEQPVEPRQRCRNQLVLVRGARRPHGREDAASGTRDIFVRCAGKPQLEFMRAVSRVDEMRVAIDKAGRNPTAVEADALGCIPACRQVRYRAREDDAPILGRQRCRLDDAEPRAAGRKRREAGIEPDRVEVHSVYSNPISAPSEVASNCFRPFQASITGSVGCGGGL